MYRTLSTSGKDSDKTAKEYQYIETATGPSYQEWNQQKRGVHYVYNDSGSDTPDVFKDHRHKYSKPTEIEAYRRQIQYRCSSLVPQVLEIVISDYLKIHSA